MKRIHNLEILAEVLLYLLYDHAITKGGELSENDLEAQLQGHSTSTFLDQASNRLEENGLIHKIYSALPTSYEIKEKGVEIVQQKLSDENSSISLFLEFGISWLDEEIDQLKQNKSGETNFSVLQEEKIVDEVVFLSTCEKIYEAELLPHKFGEIVRDESARNKSAWHADLTEKADHLVYGPYEKFGALGTYTAYFKIKIEDNALANSKILLDVYGAVNVRKEINASDFKESLKYQIFTIEFAYNIAGTLEFRVRNPFLQRNTIWVDYIAITKSPSENEISDIEIEIPAADRIVRRSDNQENENWEQAVMATAELVNALEQNNEFKELDSDDFEQRLSECRALQIMLDSPQVQWGVLENFVENTAKYIAVKFAESAIGLAAGALIGVLITLLGSV